jgi:hypothetical protein
VRTARARSTDLQAVPKVNRPQLTLHPLAVPIVNRQQKCVIFARSMTTATRTSVELLIWRGVDGTFRVELEGGAVIARDIGSIDHARSIARAIGTREVASAAGARRPWR